MGHGAAFHDNLVEVRAGRNDERRFVFDQNRCTGCHACRLACTIENGLPFPEPSWRQIVTFNPRARAGVAVVPPVAGLQPLRRSGVHARLPGARVLRRTRRPGRCWSDESKCIGCRYCSWACPYDAPRFEPDNGVMAKCTFCSHRLSDGLAPACAALCPTGALDYAELPAELLSAELEGFPQTDLGPSIRILPRTGRTGAAGGPADRERFVRAGSRDAGRDAGGADDRAVERVVPRRVYILLALLFALLSAGVVGTLRVPAPLYVAVAGVAALLSLAHLGSRPGRGGRFSISAVPGKQRGAGIRGPGHAGYIIVGIAGRRSGDGRRMAGARGGSAGAGLGGQRIPTVFRKVVRRCTAAEFSSPDSTWRGSSPASRGSRRLSGPSSCTGTSHGVLRINRDRARRLAAGRGPAARLRAGPPRPRPRVGMDRNPAPGLGTRRRRGRGGRGPGRVLLRTRDHLAGPPAQAGPRSPARRL